MRALRRNTSRRRGASLVLAAVAMVTVTAVAALAVDLGMLYKAKGDTLRAAEAAALAGASAFTEFAANDPQAQDTAIVRAFRFGQSNRILVDTVKTAEMSSTTPLSPEVVPDSQLVRVQVRREEVGTWFARLLGVNSVPISAVAAARAEAAGGGSCVKPFAIPDIWNDGNQDISGDHLEQDGEDWIYEPGQDTYNPGNPDTPATGTGYGSGLRDGVGPYTNDFGRPVSLRLPDPTAPTPPTGPRQFLPFSTNNSPDVNQYRNKIWGCDQTEMRLGTPYTVVPNTPEIPVATGEGIDSLIRSDQNAEWDDNTKTIRNSNAGNWRNSPRVIKVGFFDPSQLLAPPPMNFVTLNNIGLIFVESWDPTLNAINGRFFYFASGAGELSTANTGTLVKRLRLVQ
jgi:hypothetical protein